MQLKMVWEERGALRNRPVMWRKSSLTIQPSAWVGIRWKHCRVRRGGYRHRSCDRVVNLPQVGPAIDREFVRTFVDHATFQASDRLGLGWGRIGHNPGRTLSQDPGEFVGTPISNASFSVRLLTILNSSRESIHAA